MKVFNAASEMVVLRPFAARELISFLDRVLIKPGQESIIFGPILPKYGLRSPYKMEGNVLVCDWNKPWVCWIEESVSAVVTTKPGKAESYKQPFALASGEVEGFWLVFCDDQQLINF